jgi:hypothetical protein
VYNYAKKVKKVPLLAKTFPKTPKTQKQAKTVKLFPYLCPPLI